MTREEAKKMAQSRDCHCISGKDRDTNYNTCIDKIFDWHESEVKKLNLACVIKAKRAVCLCERVKLTPEEKELTPRCMQCGEYPS